MIRYTDIHKLRDQDRFLDLNIVKFAQIEPLEPTPQLKNEVAKLVPIYLFKAYLYICGSFFSGNILNFLSKSDAFLFTFILSFSLLSVSLRVFYPDKKCAFLPFSSRGHQTLKLSVKRRGKCEEKAKDIRKI